MKKLRKVYIALIMVFLYAPIVLLVLYSFNDSKSRAKWGGFTLRWYQELFSDKVIIPDIMPGVVSGFLMALTMSIDDFVVSFFTTGSGVSNLSITIYTMAKRGISPKINALSTLIFGGVLILMLILNLKDMKNPEGAKKIEKVKIPY